MSKEVELLNLIDELVLELLPTVENGGAALDLAGVARLAMEAADCSGHLRMNKTRPVALRIAEAAAAQGATEDLAALATILRDDVERLQKAAESDLELRICGPSSYDTDAPAAEGEGLLAEFIPEAREHLEAIEREILTLERDPLNSEAIHTLFRGFHTIKGLSAIFHLPEGEEVSHRIETLLDLVRGNLVAVSRPLVDTLLFGADWLEGFLRVLEQNIRDKTKLEYPPRQELLSRLRAQMDGPEPDAQATASAAASPATGPAQADGKGQHQNKVKVDTAKLDHLADMVGELIIAQSLVQMDRNLQASADPHATRNLAQMARITAELHKTAMALRVVPIAPIFQRMQRVFRDLARRSGKNAVLIVEGEDSELDRTIVEQLADPLMHMIRNAIDHGLETPEERVAAGKSAEGTVRLTASHHSGQIVIEISDDGRGLNRQKILARARERGLVSAEAAPGPQEILELIFEPGFSTAEKVTELSGRGVGMDVVRRQIQQLRGRIEMRSEEGRGSAFLLKLPLTLAVIDGLIVKLGEERYILPLFAVHEILQPRLGAVSTIEGRHEIVIVRDRVLPVVRIAELLGRPQSSGTIEEKVLVIIETGGRRRALVVDSVLGKQEIVIKSLGAWLGHLPGVSGGAILGDGCVGLILDLEGLFEKEGHATAA